MTNSQSKEEKWWERVPRIIGGWGFAVRPGDPDGELRFARQGE